MPAPARPTVVVVDQLEREWLPLAHADLAAAFARWRTLHPPLRRFQGPCQLLRYLHATPARESDEQLLALLALAAADPAAARLLLQALLPALKAQTQRLARRRRVSQEELWELLLFHAWTAIRTYPLASRPRAVAANLVLDVWHEATRELSRNHWPTHTQPPAPVVLPAPRQTAAAQARLRRRRQSGIRAVVDAVQAGVISRRDAALILRSRFQDVPLCQLAAEACVPYQALLKRRQRAELRLRQHRHVQANVRNRGEKLLTASGRPPGRHPQAPVCRRAPRGGSGRTRLDLKEGF